MSFVSYAQNFEDVLLHRVFGGQETGFYVDVGAYHPVIGSVTKAFYDRGWSGINIEPGSVFADLAAARPRDVNLRMAVLDRAGEIAFVEDEADGGTSRVIMDDNGGDATGNGGARMVPCDTLQALVDAHSRGRPVDFVKVDAEGAETAIVHSTDWRRLRPRVLLLEATRPWSSMLANEDWEPALLQHGYVRAYFDGINCFYIPEEDVPTLLRHFQVPVNVLDRAERYDHEMLRAALHERQAEAAYLTTERDALRTTLDDKHAEAERLTTERDALRTTLDDKHAESERLTTERDALRTTLDDKHAEAERLTIERDALRTTLDAKHAEAERLTAERDALRATLGDKHAEAEHLTTELDALRAEGARLADAVRHLEARVTPPAIDSVVAVAPPRERDHLARRTAKAAYKLLRPIVRPVVWRLRIFMTGDLSEQIWRLDQRIEALSAAPGAGQSAIFPAASLPAMLQIRDDGAAAEMRRLAVEMERTLLTLALERTPAPWMVASPAAPLALDPAPRRVALRLPYGRTTEVECVAGDLSIAAALTASGGDWEPHVRRYLESIVRPDWVCLDIGANLGAHTLSLAVLAHHGRVVSFEADAANFELLSRNAAALTAPRADITLVHRALWDRQGTLVSGGADDGNDAATIEQRLRAVVDAGAIDGIDAHIRHGTLAALPLDSWGDGHALPRLDLIRLDVEGAEAQVIQGADATLRRFRPVLLVEYNPACAVACFGQPPEALFSELATRFATINVLEADGTLTKLADWAALQARLAVGKGWEDLVCLPERQA
jgi:FkbM family methyltransferase